MSRDKFNYSHGDTGNKPNNSLNFESDGRPKSQNFDWWWYTVIQSINGHADEFDRLDSNDDGIVDESEYSWDSDKLDGLHLADIKDWVNQNADIQQTSLDGSLGDPGEYLITDGTNVTWQNLKAPVVSSDPSNPDNGECWIRNDL